MRLPARLASTAALIPILATIGCRTPEVVYQRVEVPVPVPCPEPPLLAWPDLWVPRLTGKSSPREVAEAYAHDHLILKNQLQQAFILLDGYRRKK